MTEVKTFVIENSQMNPQMKILVAIDEEGNRYVVGEHGYCMPYDTHWETSSTVEEWKNKRKIS